jgi:gliding motility-associated peptidyl-prolyl isomerase
MKNNLANTFFKLFLTSLCLYTVVPLFFYFLLPSCGNDNTEPPPRTDFSKYKEPLMKVNKYMVEKETDEINQYIARHGWTMERTGTGLRYMFLKKGSGITPKSGDVVKVNYHISLLDGTVCYSSEEDGPYEFRVESDAVESGLHEGIQLMHVGDKVKFILPSYLAHGLHGDDAKIPPFSSIVADIELLEIK